MDFDLKKRIPVELEKLDFSILPQFMSEGEKFIEEVDERRKASAELWLAGALDGTERARGSLGDRGKKKRLREQSPYVYS